MTTKDSEPVTYTIYRGKKIFWCRKCGEKIGGNDRYCRFCGEKLR